jgi:hypothetical protein
VINDKDLHISRLEEDLKSLVAEEKEMAVMDADIVPVQQGQDANTQYDGLVWGENNSASQTAVDVLFRSDRWVSVI